MFYVLKRIALGLSLLAAFLVLLAALGLGYAWWRMGAALPELAGSERVPGLGDEVEILRDEWGVPHVFANNTNDVYFGLGWAIAQDRLFQLTLNRHVAQGRLSELVGLWKPVRDIDLGLRELDLHGYGQVVHDRASPEAQAALQAYYNGLNAWLRAHGDGLPFDVQILHLLGADDSPFAATDLLGMIGIMGLSLHDSWRMDVMAERLASAVGREKASDLFPLAQGGRPAIIPGVQPPQEMGSPGPTSAWSDSATMPDLPFFRQLAWLMDSPWMGAGASNNWAVSPSRSGQSGTLLANDPHLGLSLPGVWYLAHLHTPDLDVAGATFVGMPFVVIGRNAETAWGVTNVGVDAGDYFVERLNPNNPKQVQYKGQWIPLVERKVEIKGKFSSESVVVRSTPHGPIVSSFAPEEAKDTLQPDQALSYRWAYLVDPRANELEGFYRLNQARNWQEFREATRHFSGIAQNFVYADRAGNIGLQVAGSVPRVRGGGARFRRGWDGSDEWEGIVPFDALPWLYNPTRGWVGSANNSTFEPPAPYYISSTFEPAQRFEQISHWLGGDDPLDAETMRQMQLDTRLPLARELVPQLLAAFALEPPEDGVARLGLTLLSRWNLRFASESPSATLFAVFLWRLHHALFEDELGSELVTEYRGYPADAALVTAVRGGLVDWIDNARTSEVETLPVILRQAYLDAAQYLVDAQGSDPADWLWGKLHTLQLQHPLSLVPGLARLFSLGPESVGGYNLTLLRMGGRPGEWQVGHGASTRIVVDFGQPDRILAVLPGGQSGQPRSSHFGDHFGPYLRGELLPIRLDRASVLAEGAQRLLLQP